MRASLIPACALYAAVVAVSYGSFAPQVRAHALGASLEATSSPYFIDIGYDPLEFTTGFNSRFDFELRDLSRDLLDYGHVWVRIAQGKRTVLATGIAHQSLGPTTLLYTFDQPGDYTLNVSYREGGDVLAEATFPLKVYPDPEESTVSLAALAAFLGGLIAGAAVLWGAIRLKKRAVDRKKAAGARHV